MIRLVFEAEDGRTLRLGTGNILITKVTGLDGGTLERQMQTLVDEDGCEYSEAFYDPRTISVTGYIKEDTDRQIKANMRRICNGKTRGVLKIYKDFSVYTAKVIVDSLPVFGDKIQSITNYAVHFTAYRFFIERTAAQEENVYERIDKITGTASALPCVFTERKTQKYMRNNGDVSCPFTVRITGVAKDDTSAVGESYIKISSDAGEYMKLSYNIAAGETVTVNTEDYTITSDVNGNLLHKLTDGDFYNIPVGGCTIITDCVATNADASICISYNERLLGV